MPMFFKLDFNKINLQVTMSSSMHILLLKFF